MPILPENSKALFTGASSLIGGWLGYEGQKDANDTNYQIAQDQMKFQERMSSTAWQRARADMEAAGFNPMLAFSKGPASSPAGASATMQNELGAGVASAATAMNTLSGLAQIAQSAAMTEQLGAQTEKIRSETMEKELNSARAQAQYEQEHWRAVTEGHESKKRAYEKELKRFDMDIYEQLGGNFYTPLHIANHGDRNLS